MRRRTLLRTGVVVGVVGLAGCAGDGGDDGGDGGDSTGDADQIVEVAPDGSFSFEPDSFDIAAGDTVLWRFEAGGHNVRPDSIPGDSDWTGTDGGEMDTYSEGHEHSHTFDVAGEYSYYCGPHRGAGMTGAFTVE